MVTPYLIVHGAAKALDFYRDAFGAVVVFRLVDPSGVVGHAELTINGDKIMLADEVPSMGIVGPATLGGSGVSIHLEVPDVDRFVAKAAAAGAKIERQPKDEFYGERAAKLTDRFGHVWQIVTRIEEIDPAEMQLRYAALFA